MMNFPLPLWDLVGEGKKDRAAFALTQFDVVGDFAGEAERRRTTRLCLSWVIRVALTVRRSLPIHPDQRTFSAWVSVSQRCQVRTSHGQRARHANSRTAFDQPRRIVSGFKIELE